MAIMRLTYSGTNVDFDPGEGYKQTAHKNRQINYALDMTPYRHTWGSKDVWTIPITDMSKTDADNLNTWWDNDYDMTLTPDLPGAPSTTRSVFIQNEEAPMDLRFVGKFATDADSRYAGVLILHER